MTLIKELIDIPDRVQKGDFVLRLAEDINHPERIRDNDVVTDELKTCYDAALSFLAVRGNARKRLRATDCGTVVRSFVEFQWASSFKAQKKRIGWHALSNAKGVVSMSPRPSPRLWVVPHVRGFLARI